MALVLNLRKGEDFYVKRGSYETRVVVERIDGPVRFKVKVEAGMYNVFTITDRSSSEIMPQVRVSAGKGRSDVAKLAIEAPPSVSIVRGTLKKHEEG